MPQCSLTSKAPGSYPGAGANPAAATKCRDGVTVTPRDSKSDVLGSNPSPCVNHAPVDEWLSRCSFKAEIAGSSPVRGIIMGRWPSLVEGDSL